MRIALAQINTTIGSLQANIQKILSSIKDAKQQKAQLVVFPELALCGYAPEDLLLMPSFIQAINQGLDAIVEASEGIYVILGTVRENPAVAEKKLFNTAAIIYNGKLIGFQDKSLLPTYDVFSERRYFEPASRTDVWSIHGARIAITICEDIWQHADAVEYSCYHRDPIVELKQQNPDLLINLSASPFNALKFSIRFNVAAKAAQTLHCPVMLCNLVGGNDSLVFDGYSFLTNAQGELIQLAKGFEEELLLIDTEAEQTPIKKEIDPLEDLYQALVLGVRDYFQKSGFKRACIGLSGGIDSAVVACIAVTALGQENVLAIGMPSRYTSEASINDAKQLVARLGIEFKMLSIEEPFESYLHLLQDDFRGTQTDITEENLQSRIRGTILMAFSNKFGYLVLSTGNKSEMAMGYATLYGDMCGGLAVISDVSKLQVYALARLLNRSKEIIPQNIIDRPPTAELKPNQKDSDTLPDYIILDKIVQSYVEDLEAPDEIAHKFQYPLELVQGIIRKIHLNEYKRRQAPPGIRVSKRAFSVGRKFPIVQHWNISPPIEYSK